MLVEGVIYTDRRHTGWKNSDLEARKFARECGMAGSNSLSHVPLCVLDSIDAGSWQEGWQWAMEDMPLKDLWL